MAKTKAPKEPVLEVTPTEEVAPLTDVITQELVKANITEAILADMESTFSTLEIDGVSDKQGYENMNKFRIACKNTRILTVDICEKGREKAIAEQKAWIANQKRIVDRIKALEDGAAAKQKVIDDIREEEKRKKSEAEQIILQERAVNLVKMGMNFTGDAYELEDIRISVMSIKTSDNFTWSALVAGVEKRFKEKEVIRLEEERLKEETAAAAKLLAEQNLARQEELNKRQAELEAQQKAIEAEQLRQKQAAEQLIIDQQNAEKRKQDEEQAAIKKAQDDFLKSRMSALFSLGFAQQGESLHFNGNYITVSIEALKTHPEATWPTFLNSVSNKVEARKEALEQERVAEIEKAKAEAIDKERIRVEQENAAKAKAEEEARLKKQKEEADRIAEEKRIAAAQPDLEKVKLFFNAVMALPIPDVSTVDFKLYVAALKESRKSWLTNEYSKIPK